MKVVLKEADMHLQYSTLGTVKCRGARKNEDETELDDPLVP